jgi:hypothetical protein
MMTVGMNVWRKGEVVTVVVRRLLLQGSRINSMTEVAERNENDLSLIAVL